MTGKLLDYHLKNPRVPLVVRVPQFENHCSKAYRKPSRLELSIVHYSRVSYFFRLVKIQRN